MRLPEEFSCCELEARLPLLQYFRQERRLMTSAVSESCNTDPEYLASFWNGMTIRFSAEFAMPRPRFG